MTTNKNRKHIPVLLKEVIDHFDPKPGKKFIDATLGFGGHTKPIVDQGAKVLGIDWDPKVAEKTKKRLLKHCPDASYLVVVGNFKNIESIAKNNNFCPVDGVIFDLGISLWHYKGAERGFSFLDQNLDMRINPQINQTAEKIINNYSLNELDELFTKFVQEKLAKQIARTVVSARQVKPIKSAKKLADLVEQVYKKNNLKTDYHPATKVFLGLRIEVNKEFENLEEGLNQGFQVLKVGGKMLVITFHSGEDRIVKFFNKHKKRKGKAKTKLVFPTKNEIINNPLARSAKLRILEKIK